MSDPHVSTVSTDSEDTAQSPGELLRAEREQQRLSREEVAEQLNLRPSLVADLEQDNYEQVPVATYRRGYLRAYARLLGINDSKVVAAHDRTHGRQDLDARQVKPVTTIKPPNRWGRILFRLVTLIVVIALIVLTLSWWQNRDSSPDYDSAGNGDAAAQESVESNSSGEDSSLPPLPEQNIETGGPPPESSDSNAASLSMGSEDINLAAALIVANRPLNNADSERNNLQVSTPEGRDGATAGLSGAEETATSQSSEQDDAPNPRQARLVFNGDSWVDIRDASGTTVLRGLQQGGTSTTIRGNPPFHLTIGNASQVELDYLNEPVDLSSHAGGNNVARFSLGSDSTS
ncbi:cytoskeleton protein RodZ [Kushneria sinocarnis]|uniref:Cytoskeleton protein RodZ n=1 Tax=Kushneria sinocarnis TaxID=595502 RepID=A0A420X064_9GAMM|nr:RodZ domain-containing protein [Kushneria sinocarnis]RKR06907.1 cytoskeleton protein RodZ [Kushneria sinocarnis]